MNQNRFTFLPGAALFASVATLAFAAEPAASGRGASDPAPAPAAAQPAENADSAPSAESESVRPGRAPRGRELTPEMRAYVDRLEAIRKARDEQALAAAQAERDIGARKAALAAADEEVKSLVDKVSELREALAAAEKALEERYAADEALVALETKKTEAEKARDAKQREMHAAVAAAMDERAARFHGPRPVAPVRAPAPAAVPARGAPAAQPASAPAAE